MPVVDTAEIWKILQKFGFTERKLALSDLDDARLIAQQVCEHFGCICENQHVQSVWELIHDCQLSEPIQKRLRGDHRVDEFQISSKSTSLGYLECGRGFLELRNELHLRWLLQGHWG